MKEADIRKYAQLMKELDLTGLEITEDNQVVRLERSTPTVAAPVVVAEAPAAAPAAAPAVSENADYISVKSPIVGLFYAASAENAEPYVSLGDRVTQGQTLCIVEAMKLMNEISAISPGTRWFPA